MDCAGLVLSVECVNVNVLDQSWSGLARLVQCGRGDEVV